MAAKSKPVAWVHVLTGKLGEVVVKNIMVSLLWLDLLLVIGLVATLWSPHSDIVIPTLKWLLGVAVGATILAYGWWAVVDPDRLQTETHRAQMFKMIQQGSHQPIVRVTPTSNPALPPYVADERVLSASIEATSISDQGDVSP